MAQFRSFRLAAILGVAAFAMASASLTATCATICTFGGHNTSCNERVHWVMTHVTKDDEVVANLPDRKDAMTCKESLEKIIDDCPVCKPCSSEQACKFYVGELVEVKYFDSKWHYAKITALQTGGKYEVTFEHRPVIISTSAVRKAWPRPSPAPVVSPAYAVAHAPAPAFMHASVKKYEDMTGSIAAKSMQPRIAGVAGLVCLIGLAVMAARKVAKSRQCSEHLVEVQE